VDGGPAFRRVAESVEAAQHSVWLTVTFLWPHFQMPGGRGSVFDVLDRVAARGADVRMLCWRPDPEMLDQPNTFWGSPEHHASLRARDSGVLIRWDQAQPGFCQHQKSWLIDAGRESATGFIGSANLNPHAVVAPGHRGDGHHHEVYVEIAGPATVDMHHNFAQRWNEASERAEPDGSWGNGTDLAFPAAEPRSRGASTVQIQRTIHPGRYRNGTASPGWHSCDIAAGERTILRHYETTIAAATNSIYLENQHFEAPEILGPLRAALERGVQVVAVVPGGVTPPPALVRHDNFTLAGIAGLAPDGQRRAVHVHAKLMLVDDRWATVGSGNLHRWSLTGNAEMNATIQDPSVTRELRCQLFAEHIGDSTHHLSDRAALRRFGQIARENRRRWDEGDTSWSGLAFSLTKSTKNKQNKVHGPPSRP
jgi:phosphatidylserine/phosphatidylglycerophosphate/cardiolipin synthase-like enzyme